MRFKTYIFFIKIPVTLDKKLFLFQWVTSAISCLFSAFSQYKTSCRYTVPSETLKETLQNTKITAPRGHTETYCIQPSSRFSFKGSSLLIRFLPSELSGLDSACLCRYINEGLISIILVKMEIHFFLLIYLVSVVKVTANISEIILLGFTCMTSYASAQTIYVCKKGVVHARQKCGYE